ncbi:hypothetical protein E4U41_004239 [Claviceps citrina]|nr:hypothetical protein E4U41_004239 [Claviceps citrina]
MSHGVAKNSSEARRADVVAKVARLERRRSGPAVVATVAESDHATSRGGCAFANRRGNSDDDFELKGRTDSEVVLTGVYSVRRRRKMLACPRKSAMDDEMSKEMLDGSQRMSVGRASDERRTSVARERVSGAVNTAVGLERRIRDAASGDQEQGLRAGGNAHRWESRRQSEGLEW